MSAKRVYFDTLRSLAFGGISGAYAAIGTAFTINPRILIITNGTQGDMIISDDNTNASGKMFLKAGTSRVLDFCANMAQNRDDLFVVAIGTIFYVKQVTTPTSGAVYLEAVYGTTV